MRKPIVFRVLGRIAFAILPFVFSCSHSTVKTTDGDIAVTNLNAQVSQYVEASKKAPQDIHKLEQAVAFLLMRPTFLGTYQDFVQAENLITSYLEQKPNDLKALKLKVKHSMAVHRFKEADALLALLKEQLPNDESLNEQTLSLWHATGHKLNAVYTARIKKAKQNPSFATFTALAGVAADLGKFTEADSSFERALKAYRDVSPLPVAWILFQRGLMWSEKADMPSKAKRYYLEAVTRLPKYVVATIHLAELEDSKAPYIEKLERFREFSDEPEILAKLAEWQQDEESTRKWTQQAEESYQMWLKTYPAAFWDHAAEFYLGAGNNRNRAFELAMKNFNNRQTARSLSLLMDAASEADRGKQACELVGAFQGKEVVDVLKSKTLQSFCKS